MAVTTAAVVGAAASVGGALADNNNQRNARSDAERNRAESRRYIDEMAAKTQGQLFSLFQPIQQNNNAAMLAGLDVYKQAFPAAMNSFNQGNMNAQRTFAAGLPQMNAAILGGNLNLSGLQPQQAQVNPQAMQALFNPQAPSFAPIQV
jgi:hypothetical protein